MNEFLVTLEEAVRLVGFCPYESAMFAKTITCAIREKENSSRDVDLMAYAACFNAGIVEGIRLERARRGAAASRRVDTPAEGCRKRVSDLLAKIKSEKALERIYRYAVRRYQQDP